MVQQDMHIDTVLHKFSFTLHLFIIIQSFFLVRLTCAYKHQPFSLTTFYGFALGQKSCSEVDSF